MAYTKYSLTPADNNAAPPNGAPEGMLPSAVNDTMRDMMSQIRDVGDGIRGGTYTMTAPVITGGSINGTTVGATTRSTGAFTTLASNGATTFTAGTASTSTTTGTAVITGGLGVSGRINAANFDGIVGANTAAAGNFTTLGATGVATFSAGTVSAPAITTTGDTNTGIFFPAADTIAFAEGGVESMRITSAGDVGIGQSSPVNIAGYTIQTINNPINGGGVYLQSNGTTIGRILNTATDFFVGGVSASSACVLQSGGAERMRIDSTGNVGIGISSPGARLDVNPSSGTIFRCFTSGVAQVLIGNGGASTNFYDADTQVFRRGNTGEAMRLDSNGNLLFANTTSNAVGIPCIEIGGAAGDGLLTIRRGTTAAAGQVIFYNPNGAVGAINTSGSSTAYITSSDYRLKENIAPMTGALDVVSALKPVTYKWKVDGSDGQGFIAHELQAVVPDCVTGEKDAVDAKGKPQYQGVDTSFLVATLTASIQELKAIVDAQAARIAALESK